MRRILLFLLLTPLLLIVAATLLLPLLLDEERLLAIAAEALKEKTGATLAVSGDTRLRLLPRIALSVEQVELTLPGEGQPDLSAGRLDIGVKPLPLLSGEVQIQRLALNGLLVTVPAGPEQPSIDSSDLSDAELDAFYRERRKVLKETGEDAGLALAAPMALEVAELSMDDSRLVLMEGAGKPDRIVEIESLRATDLNLAGRPVPLSLALSVPATEPGGEAVTLQLDTTLRLDQASQQLSLDQLEAELQGATAEPLQLSASGGVDLERVVADLKLTLSLGSARGEGKLRFASFESPQIDADLHLNEFTPALLALAGPEAAAGSNDESDGNTVDDGDAPLPLAPLRSIDTRAKLAIDSARFGNHEIRDLRAQLRAVDGVVTLNRLSGSVHGGTLSASATLNAAHNRARLNTSGKLENVDLPQLLAALEAEPKLSGQASLNWQLAAEGRSRNALRDSLSGPVKIHTRELVLKGLGIERMLCQTVALVNREKLAAELPTDSAFEALTVDLQLAEGKARLSPLHAELANIQLTGKGAAQLDSLDFKADFAARLDPGLAEVDPACRVNERYTAIDWPLECEGNLNGDAGDWCRVDSGEIIEDLGKNEVQRKVQEEAGRLFERLLKKD
ncbi:AsmA family protein [Parahaliea aestuarii]|uniref:AsmA family protein n=1 Tax=Parahaliea aestuarii TaxID=1852021 RepID=A0A5C9A3F5_9GAMM|nr:AsmA family protein [Parahaliea aestuarii]TXS94472.1 AsmA family protein [Parahaliea aestuarii]